MPYKLFRDHFCFKCTLKIFNCDYVSAFLHSCKPRIGGRKCDRCAPGYYRFPDCLPCDCNQGGVTSNVCDPDTGRCLCKVGSINEMSYLRTPCFLVFFVWLSLCHCRHVCREMLLGSGVILVGKGPSILNPQTLSAVPAASALESLTSVRAPANAGGRCVGFSCSCMSTNAFKNFLPAAPFGWQTLCGKQWVF